MSKSFRTPLQVSVILCLLLKSCLSLDLLRETPKDTLKVGGRYIVLESELGCKSHNYSMMIERDGCTKQIVYVNTCIGACFPANDEKRTTTKGNQGASVCKCCLPDGKREMILVSLNGCQPGIDPTIRMETAKNCICQSC